MSKPVAKWRAIPMGDWPDHAFHELGLRRPYGPGNLTIRREAVEATRHLDGVIVECGTYQGQGLASLAWFLRETDDSRPMFGLDSFAGFPDASAADLIDGELPNHSTHEYFAETGKERVISFLDELDLSKAATLISGLFADTLPSVPFEKISVLILDCDLYDSYRLCLHHLYEKVQVGGWIVFDEYFSPKYPGARIAIDEFFAQHAEKPMLASHLLDDDDYERWYVVRRESGTA